MKRFLLIFVLMIGFIAEAGAVLKEKDLEQTLAILQSELEQCQAADHQPAADHEAGRPERADALFAGADPPV